LLFYQQLAQIPNGRWLNAGLLKYLSEN